MDHQKLKKCLDYNSDLRKIGERTLRKKHHETFFGSDYYIDLPDYVHRSVLERRLFILFCLNNWYYSVDAPATKQFLERAKYILSKEYADEYVDNLKQVESELRQYEQFSKSSIDQMPIERVDRFLAGLGINIEEATDKERRKVLWECFNLPVTHVPPLYNKKGKRKYRYRRAGKNKYVLRDIIRKNPTMNYAEFIHRFGNVMPGVTQNVFNNARHVLRKKGFDIPLLKKKCFLD